MHLVFKQKNGLLSFVYKVVDTVFCPVENSNSYTFGKALAKYPTLNRCPVFDFKMKVGKKVK